MARPPDTTPPSRPTGLQRERAGNEPGQPLSWSGSCRTTAASTLYRIQASTAARAAGCCEIATAPRRSPATSFTDTSLAPTAPTYYYTRAREASNASRRQRSLSDEARRRRSRPPPSPEPPAEPERDARQRPGHPRPGALLLDNGGSSITGYKVYRGTSSGGEGSAQIAHACGNELHGHEPRQRHDLLLHASSAVNAVGDSTASNEARATPVAPDTAPEPPPDLTGDARQRPGQPQLERSFDDGGVSIYRLQASAAERARAASTRPSARLRDDLHGHEPRATASTLLLHA